MKEKQLMKVPDKIWVHELSAKELNVPFKEYHVEYTRTDAFIEKACDAYCKVCKISDCRRDECNYYANFKKLLTGE